MISTQRGVLPSPLPFTSCSIARRLMKKEKEDSVCLGRPLSFLLSLLSKYYRSLNSTFAFLTNHRVEPRAKLKTQDSPTQKCISDLLRTNDGKESL